MDTLISISAFIVAISLLIAIHEFGHFWVARKMGVKVLRYSIGFGRPLWLRRFGEDQTEFVIAAIPLGGYVKMLDERVAEVDAHERHRAFNQKSLGRRFAVVFAGPLFNFMFAAFAYWLVFMIGISGVKAVIGDVTDGSPAARAGIMSGQQIIAVAGEPTPIWDVTLEQLLPVVLRKEVVEITLRDKSGITTNRLLDLTGLQGEIEPGELFKSIGFQPWRPSFPAIVGQVLVGKPAGLAGIKENDRIVRIDDTGIENWAQLVEYVSARPDQNLRFEIMRNGKSSLIYVTPEASMVDGKKVGRIGIGPQATKLPDDLLDDYHYSPVPGFVKGLEKTWDNAALTLSMIGRIITGEASLKNLSGPVNIAIYAGYSASAGLARFIDFLAIVSISLGVLNLLPIPVLDGGHLMFYILEFFRGKPLSEEAEEKAQRIGMAFLLMLMMVAFYNDLSRLIGN